MKKIPKISFIVFGIIAVGAFALLTFKQVDNYMCPVCGSRERVAQWRLGFWSIGSIPLTPKSTVVMESHFDQDFFSNGHEHEWQFGQESPYYCFGTVWGGCAIGRRNFGGDVFHWYELVPDFRALVQKKIQDGSLARSNFMFAVSDTGTNFSADVSNLMAEFSAR